MLKRALLLEIRIRNSSFVSLINAAYSDFLKLDKSWTKF
jgi:hypothetical protein